MLATNYLWLFMPESKLITIKYNLESFIFCFNILNILRQFAEPSH
jgi:hypothetical protein